MNYMLIDLTELEHIQVILVAPLREMALHGRLAKMVGGRTVIGPPVEGRGFSKLSKEQLQYLYWNTCNEAPPEDYAELVKGCLAVIEKIPVDPTPLNKLEATVQRLCPDEVVTLDDEGVKTTKIKRVVNKGSSGENTPKGAPNPMSTTGQVWTIANELLAKCAEGELPDRKLIIDACIEEGINQATASTQYAKWKKYVLSNVA